MKQRTGPPSLPIEIVNVPDVSPRDDDFTRLDLARPVEWTRFSGLPANALERRAKGIRLSRYRAAVQGALAARRGGVVISHLPLMSAAVGTAMRALRRNARHLAFSFNFTDRPTGGRLAYMRQALAGVEQFAVYSEFERELYADLFGFERRRFAPVVWTQSVPPVAPKAAFEIRQPYFCAIGGEGRDLSMVVDTARQMSAMHFVVVARPRTLSGLALPANVTAFTNLPLAQTWAIASGSLGVLIPLRTPDTCCGHITLVSAKQLGIPIAITRSPATREYVKGRAAIVECEAGDTPAFRRAVERLVDDRDAMRGAAQNARSHEIAFHDRSEWARYLDDFLSRGCSRTTDLSRARP